MTTLENPFDAIKSFCPYMHSMFPPKYFDNFSPEGGCSEGLDAFRFFLMDAATEIARNPVSQDEIQPEC